MGEQLTRRQRAIYEFVLGRVRGRGIPPTLTEIATAFGLASPSGVADHLKALERKGWIRRRPGISRGIEILGARDGGSRRGVWVPVVGRVPSHSGLRPTERARRHVVLDGRLASGDVVAVRVGIRGLEGHGILRGDLLVIRQGREPRPGDLAVARAGEETVLVEARSGGSFRRMDAAGGPVSDCRPLGPVVAVLRTLGDPADGLREPRGKDNEQQGRMNR